MTTDKLVMDREDIERAALLAALVLDGALLDSPYPEPREYLIELAQSVFDSTKHPLLYAEPPGRSMRFEPAGFHQAGFYTESVHEFLSGLDDEVRSENPVLVQMVKDSAALVDNASYSFGFRRRILDSLNETAKSLLDAASEE